MKPVTRNLRFSLLTANAAAIVTISAPSILHAANTTWVGNTDANFSTLANWNALTPNANTPVFGVAGSSGTTLNNDIVGATYVGFTFNAGASAFTIGGNAFTLTGNIVNNSTAAQRFSSGANITTATARTFTTNTGGGNLIFNNNISQTAGSGSTFNGTGTSTLAGTNSFTFNVNDQHLNVTAGSVDITGETTVSGGSNTSAGGLRTSAGTTVTVSTGGTLNMNGNSSGTKADTIIGLSGAASNLIVAGGNLNYGENSGIFLGNVAGNGVLSVNSGTATFASGAAGSSAAFIGLGRQGATGTINLNGGTLATSRTFGRNGGDNNNNRGTANFNFNGGTLQALANNSDWLNSTTRTDAIGTSELYAMTATTVKSGGAIIDSNTFNVGINTILAHDAALGATLDGGLTKIAAGTLTLGGANTYTGTTTVNAGSLAINGDQSAATGNVSVSGTGTRLIGTGTVGGNTTIQIGAIQSAGGAVANVNKVGKQTFDAAGAGITNLTYAAGSIFEWDLNANNDTDGYDHDSNVVTPNINVGTRGGDFDAVDVTGSLAVDSTAAGAIFRVVLGSSVVSDAFWEQTQTWTDIFGGGFNLSGAGFNNSLLQVVDTSGSTYNQSSLNAGYGFSVSGTTLTWSAVPEPTTALVSLVLGAGLFRRSRRAGAI